MHELTFKQAANEVAGTGEIRGGGGGGCSKPSSIKLNLKEEWASEWSF